MTKKPKLLIISLLIFVQLTLYTMAGMAQDKNANHNTKYYKPFTAFLITEEIYDCDMWVIITDDTLQAMLFVQEQMSDSSISLEDFDCRGITFIATDKPACMWIPHLPRDGEDLATVSHEIFHMAKDIMNHVNIPLDESSEEAWAYLIQDITKQFYKNVLRKK